MTEKKTTRWKPGQSGNPKGRKPGTSEITRLRALIEPHAEDLIGQLVTMAKAGDIGAARLLLERVLPPVRAVEQATPFELPEGSLTDQGKSVFAAISAGDLAPTQGAQLLSALGGLSKIFETDELAARVAALEAKNGNP